MHTINFRLHSRVAATILAAGSLLVAQTPGQSSDPAAPGGSAAGSNSAASGSASGSDSKMGSKAQASQLTDTEKTFVQEALESGRHEVAMGKMAAKQASDATVKTYAKKLVSDHTAANKKLEGIAKKGQVTVTKSTAMAADTELTAAKGGDFDKAFAGKAVENHQKGIAKYEAAEKDATNPDLKSYISSTLPTLREHLEQARSLNPNAGPTSFSGSDKRTPGTNGQSGAGSSVTPGASTNPGSSSTPGSSTTPGSSAPGNSSTTPQTPNP